MHIAIAVLRVLFYLAVGPLAGMLAGSLIVGLGTLSATGSLQDLAFGADIFSPDNLRITYTVGLLPSLLTGIVALLLARVFSGPQYWLWIAFGAGSLSMALAWVVFGTAPIAGGMNPFTFSLVIALAAALAGFVCAMLFDLIAGRVRRDA